MKMFAAAWCAALFLGLAAAAGAQTQPPYLGPVIEPQCWLCSPSQTPSPIALAKEAGAEQPGVTNVARGIYSNMLGGSIGRYRLTAELQQRWTPALQAKASAQLVSFGTPSWSFVGNGLTSAGTVSVYRLAYEKAHPIYMSVGVADNGVVYDLRLADSVSAVAPAP